MEDKKSELLQYAREYATANKDLYELLCVPADAAPPEIHRAWRKASLKHHPDKAKNFDPELWQLFERARDVLSSAEARSAYDSARAAAVQAQRARAALDAKKRAMIDDLEARERGVKRKTGEGRTDGGRHMMTEAEKRVLMEKGREHLEKRRKLKEEAEARERARQRTRTGDGAAGASGQGGEAERQQSQPRQSNYDRVPISTDDGGAVEDMDAPPPPPTDEYDRRIADLERKLRERKAEKAARKAEKKKNNNHKPPKDEGPFSLAGENRQSPPMPAVFQPPSVHMQHPTTTSSTPTPPGDFSSTMAKLRAAQREKERKRAEAEAVAAAAAAAAGGP
jgi:DnaJ family protein C protein 17